MQSINFLRSLIEVVNVDKECSTLIFILKVLLHTLDVQTCTDFLLVFN